MAPFAHTSGTSAASTPATVRRSPQSNENGALADLTDVFGGGPSAVKPTSLPLSQQAIPSRSPPLDTPTSSRPAPKKNSGLEALDELSDVLIKQNLPSGKPWAAEAERYYSFFNFVPFLVQIDPFFDSVFSSIKLKVRITFVYGEIIIYQKIFIAYFRNYSMTLKKPGY